MELSMPLWLSNFEEEIDSYIFISSRDNKLYFGILRAYDQHGNIFLSHCVEKIIVAERNIFSDVYVGNLIIRGDNIAYFGSVDERKYEKIFDYSKKNENFQEGQDSSDKSTKSKDSNEPHILQYKPINHILKYLNGVNNDSSVFDN